MKIILLDRLECLEFILLNIPPQKMSELHRELANVVLNMIYLTKVFRHIYRMHNRIIGGPDYEATILEKRAILL